MKSTVHYTILLIIAAALFSGCASIKDKVSGSTSGATSDSGLVSSLTQKLGVSNEQATGGAGAILGYAKEKLSPEDFATVSKSVPEADSLIKAAPKDDGMSAKMGNMTSAMSGGDSSSSGLGSLAGSFGKLGLSPDMVGKFMPVIMEYVNAKGGSKVSGLLGGVLK